MNPDPNFDNKIIMQGIHIELTDAMRQVIAEKFGALLGHSERILRINVRLHRDQQMGLKNHYTATAQVEIPGPDLVASAEGMDAYGVLEALAGKLDHQLEIRHGRRKDRRNHPHDVELPAELPKVSEAVVDADGDAETGTAEEAI